MSDFLDLLKNNRNYRYTWMGQVVSEIGDYFNNIAVFALVMEKSGSGLVVTGVMLARAIPAVLAYKDHGPPTIGSNATLIFDVKLISIEAPAAATPPPAPGKPAIVPPKPADK